MRPEPLIIAFCPFCEPERAPDLTYIAVPCFKHSNKRQRYRMWEAGEDMGTAHGRAAFLWLIAARRYYTPSDGELPRIEPVSEDEPEFLPKAQP